MRKIVLIGALAALWLLAALWPMAVGPAMATIILPSTLDHMANRSDAVVVGSVVSQGSYWENGNIFTDVQVDVSEWVKADNPDQPARIAIKVFGGQVGDIRAEVDQAPSFTVGEEVLLFLVKWKGAYTTYGLNYGVYRIFTDVSRGTKTVTGPLFHNLEVFDLQTRERSVNTVPPGEEELGLFKNRIRGLLRE